MAKKRKNVLVEIARRHGRKYVTPEDVTAALDAGVESLETIRLDTLEVLGGQAGTGAEDWSLVAFVAWRGERNEYVAESA